MTQANKVAEQAFIIERRENKAHQLSLRSEHAAGRVKGAVGTVADRIKLAAAGKALAEQTAELEELRPLKVEKQVGGLLLQPGVVSAAS